jgi:WD40 repeat protein
MIVLNGLGYRVDGIAFADDGHAILATSWGGATAVWRLPEGGRPTRFEGFAGAAFTPDGKFIVGAKRDVIGRMPLPPSPANFIAGTSRIEWLGNMNCMQFSPDHGRLVAAMLGKKLLWWSWPDFKSLATWAMELCGQWTVADLAFSPDGASVAVLQHDGLTLHDTVTGQTRWTGQMKANTNFGCVAWSPDGRVIATGGGKLLRLFDSTDGSRIAESTQSSKHFLDAEFTRDGRLLAAVSYEETVKLFDTRSWKVQTELAWQVGGLRALAFSRDGALAATGGKGKKVVVWDLEW